MGFVLLWSVKLQIAQINLINICMMLADHPLFYFGKHAVCLVYNFSVSS